MRPWIWNRERISIREGLEEEKGKGGDDIIIISKVKGTI